MRKLHFKFSFYFIKHENQFCFLHSGILGHSWKLKFGMKFQNMLKNWMIKCLTDLSRLFFAKIFEQLSVKIGKNPVFSRKFSENSENFQKTQVLKIAYIVKFVKNNQNFSKTQLQKRKTQRFKNWPIWHFL